MRLKAPDFFQSAEVDGVPYEADADGFVVVLNPDHVGELLAHHGFTDPNAPAAPVASAETAVGASPSAAAEAVLVAVWDDYPAITAALTAGANGEVPPSELSAVALLDLVEAQIAAAVAEFDAFLPNGADDADQPALYGSSTLGAHVEVGLYTVQLGGLVAASFAENAPLSVADWNNLSEAERDARLQGTLERLANDPVAAEAELGASIVSRGDGGASEPPQDAQDGPETPPAGTVTPATAENGPSGPENGPADASEGDETDADPQDPAERPDFSTWDQPKTLSWLKPRGVTWKGNPSKAVAHQMANDYWDAKHGPAAE